MGKDLKFYGAVWGVQLGAEEDYMGLDLIAELDALDSPMEFEILSHDVI